ncbi:MAG: VOC family protein, partial [Cypionkella sp.]|nr:VOC family protein [Cypionkella sp.]
MPVPSPVLYPAFNVIRLSHVELAVKDLAASRAFYVDLLGLQVSHEDAEAIYLRAMEERGHHCVILRKADMAAVHVLGFKVYAEADLDAAHAIFSAQ